MFDWFFNFLSILFAPIVSPISDAFEAAADKGADEVFTLAALGIIAASLAISLVVRPMVNNMARDIRRLWRYRTARTQQTKFGARMPLQHRSTFSPPLVKSTDSSVKQLRNTDPSKLGAQMLNTGHQEHKNSMRADRPYPTVG